MTCQDSRSLPRPCATSLPLSRSLQAVLGLIFAVVLQRGASDSKANPKGGASDSKADPKTDSTTEVPSDGHKSQRRGPTMSDGDKKMGGDAWGFSDGSGQGHLEHCRHGDWDVRKKKCVCFEHWSTAGITDTIDFFEGACEQYQCQSDKICQDVLGIPEATCPVENWNCYCGFKWAFYSMGHGYETPRKEGGGECMGVMYTLSVWGCESLMFFIERAWKYFLGLALFLLPVGRKRANCDHQRPSMLFYCRKVCGCPNRCRGECVLSTEYNFDSFLDDIAWPLYIVELGVWFYVFFATLYVIFLFIWSVVLWAMVVTTVVLLIIFASCAACAEGGGAICETCGIDCTGAAGGADCCCSYDAAGGFAVSSSDTFFWSGTFPYDPLWGYGGYGHVEIPSSDSWACSCCCRPIACLIFVYPVMPENMWGGLLGFFFLGTHTRTAVHRTYQGGSAFVEFLGMGWRRRGDLHDDQSWRRQVHDFLLMESDNQQPVVRRSVTLSQRFPNMDDIDEQSLRLWEGDEYRTRRVFTISRTAARVIVIERPFSIEEDGCFSSSFSDYQNNNCWICTEGGAEWDMWVSCKHLFCKKCSTEMLHRRMPCPLCRVSSSTVLRGRPFYES